MNYQRNRKKPNSVSDETRAHQIKRKAASNNEFNTTTLGSRQETPKLQHDLQQRNKFKNTKQPAIISRRTKGFLLFFWSFYLSWDCSKGDGTEQRRQTPLWLKKSPYCSLPSSLPQSPPCCWMIQNKENTHPYQKHPRIKRTRIERPAQNQSSRVIKTSLKLQTLAVVLQKESGSAHQWILIKIAAFLYLETAHLRTSRPTKGGDRDQLADQQLRERRSAADDV